jgi:raffinose/stachyose/melibiose transport system permease protein
MKNFIGWVKRRHVRYNLIFIPFLLILGIIWMYPFFWVISASIKTNREMFTAGANLIPKQIIFPEHYVRAWDVANFSTYFGNSVLYTVSSVIIILIKSVLCGYALARYKFPGSRFLHGLILATLFLPLASSIIPTFDLFNAIGILNTRWAVILAQGGGSGVLWILLFIGTFRTIPEDIFDSAKVDGANYWQTFWLVLPLARPVIATVVIFSFLWNWNNFTTPLIFTLGAPELRTLSVGMYYFSGEEATDWTGFAAATVISIVPVLIVFLLFQSYFVKGLAGAVKQ